MYSLKPDEENKDVHGRSLDFRQGACSFDITATRFFPLHFLSATDSR